MNVDVLCVGVAAFDLVFAVAEHPGPDEKVSASSLTSCGGGPAANAAITVAKLGGRAAFAGYLGDGVFGQQHLEELREAGVVTDLVARGPAPTPLSTILVKPDGRRTVVNYRSQPPLPAGAIDFSRCRPEVILFDGHEPHLSLELAREARRQGISTILDAGSLHLGTELLAAEVDYLVAAERYAGEFTGEEDPEAALAHLGRLAPFCVVTLGEKGLVWRNGDGSGRMDAFDVNAVDTTGAGDSFHGAFAIGVARQMAWGELLVYASAVAALCCTGLGARLAIPTQRQVEAFLAGKDHPTITGFQV